MQSNLMQVGERSRNMVGDTIIEGTMLEVLAKCGPDSALNIALCRWAESSPRPLVLLLDEIDSLVGDTLISVLKQLRAGYDERPASFPQSIILCGVRDVCDYRIYSGAKSL